MPTRSTMMPGWFISGRGGVLVVAGAGRGISEAPLAGKATGLERRRLSPCDEPVHKHQAWARARRGQSRGRDQTLTMREPNQTRNRYRDRDGERFDAGVTYPLPVDPKVSMA